MSLVPLKQWLTKPLKTKNLMIDYFRSLLMDHIRSKPLISKMKGYAASIRGNVEYWKNVTSQLNNMVEHLPSPTFFYFEFCWYLLTRYFKPIVFIVPIHNSPKRYTQRILTSLVQWQSMVFIWSFQRMSLVAKNSALLLLHSAG